MIVLTLNLNAYGDGHGRWAVRRRLIAEAIRRHGPDVVALQAVSRDPQLEGGVDQAAQLAMLMPEYRHVFVIPAEEKPERQNGSAFLSRSSLENVMVHPLSRNGDDPDGEDPARRILIAVQVGSCYLFNAHYSWVPSQTAANVSQTLDFLRRQSGQRLLVGDLNTPPDQHVLRPLQEEGWTDIWSWCHPNEPGYTFESNAPNKRIDYAWASPELRSAIKNIEIIAAPPNGTGARLSDHQGLLVTLSS